MSGSPPPRPAGGWWLVLAPPLVSSALLLGVLAWSSSGFTAGGRVDALSVGVVLGNVAPGLAFATISAVMLVGRARVRTRVGLLVTGLVLLTFVGLVLADVVWGTSSTSPLAFLFLPVPLLGLVLLGVVVAVALQAGRTSDADVDPDRALPR